MASAMQAAEPATPHSTVKDGVPCTPVFPKVPDGHGGHIAPEAIQEVMEAPHKKHPSQPRFLPPILTGLSWIAGKWETWEAGKCRYPTIKDFTYSEKIEFLFAGQPMLDYKAVSWNPVVGKDALLHREEGFLRIKPDSNRIALVLAHNFGVSEMLEGTFEDNKMVLETTGIFRMSFSKDPAVKRTRRTFQYYPETEELEQVLEMETANTPMTEHLRIKYKRETNLIPLDSE